MSITSIQYFAFLAVILLLYYIIPIKYRWTVLLTGNFFFLWKVNSLLLFAVWLITATITYFVGVMELKKKNKPLLIVGVTIIALTMLIMKDLKFFIDISNRLSGLLGLTEISSLNIIAPLGISYYSLVWIGYMLDSYWGTCNVETNYFKFITFAGYFPVITSGPIARYQEIKENIICGNRLSYKNITFGAQRILWGLFKKLVISERVAIAVNTVYEDSYMFPGFYIWIAMILFVVQLYTDFSGCIDIVLGTSEMFGIVLPENFNLPFLALTLEEIWRRWHITLGGWLRDYILYPILKSNLFQNIGKRAKKTFGKKYGKKMPTWLGLIISWFLIGFWHGGNWNYIFGVGLFFGAVIILSDATSTLWDKVKCSLRINTNTFGYKTFQRARTFFIFMIGLSFFRSYDGIRSGFTLWKNALTIYNPWILFDNPLEKLGLSQTDIRILFVSMTVMIVLGIVRHYKEISVRELVSRENLLFRWIVYIVLILFIVIYGCYGTDFDSASFIYQRF